jgi:hypothetical protein
MSYNSYNQYGRMTTEEKDRYCDSNVQLIANKIRQHEVREGVIINDHDPSRNKLINDNSRKHTLKRQLTSSSYIGDINSNEYNKYKQRRHDGNNEDEINEDENNDEYISIIDQNSAATSETNVNNGRIVLNSINKNKTNNNGNYNGISYVPSSHHTNQRHAQEDKNKINKMTRQTVIIEMTVERQVFKETILQMEYMKIVII